MSKPWMTWLTIWCCGVVAFAAVLMGAAFSATEAPARALIALLGAAAPAPFDAAMRFSTGLMGAVSLGWGLTLLALVRFASRREPLGSAFWGPLTAAVLAWFVIDSAISAATGFALNIVSNVVLIAGWLAPVILGGALRAPRRG